MWIVVGAAVTMLAAVLAVPALRDLLRLAAPSWLDVAIIAAAAPAALPGCAGPLLVRGPGRSDGPGG